MDDATHTPHKLGNAVLKGGAPGVSQEELLAVIREALSRPVLRFAQQPDLIPAPLTPHDEAGQPGQKRIAEDGQRRMMRARVERGQGQNIRAGQQSSSPRGPDNGRRRSG